MQLAVSNRGFYICVIHRKHCGMVLTSGHKPGGCGVQVDGQRISSNCKWFHVRIFFFFLILGEVIWNCSFQTVQFDLSWCTLLYISNKMLVFRYFRKGTFFGLACFANMPVESELERGARMKSVGILSPSYTLLYRYMHFLENQVK